MSVPFGSQIAESVLQGSNTLLFGLLLGFARVLPGSQQAARAFAGFECLPEGFAAAFAFGMDGGEAVVPEAALLLVEGAVVVGDLGGQLLQAVVFEEGVQRWRVGVLPGAQPFGALVEVGGVEVGELTAVAPEAAGHGGGEAGFVRVEGAQ